MPAFPRLVTGCPLPFPLYFGLGLTRKVTRTGPTFAYFEAIWCFLFYLKKKSPEILNRYSSVVLEKKRSFLRLL